MMKGHKHSEESKRKMSKNHKGQISWLKRKHLPKYLKENLRIKNTGKKLTEETKNKISDSLKGIKRIFTEEHKEKLRKLRLGKQSHRKGLSQIKEYGKEKANELKEKNRQNAINTLSQLKKSKISQAEKILKKYFIKNNINFIHQWKYKYGIADFFLPDFNMIVECDGEYWHSKPDYIIRDKRKRDYLRKKGYIVFVHSSEKVVKNKENYK